MRPEDVYELTGAADPRISPDGTRVAYVVWSIDKDSSEYWSSIWVAPVDGSGEPQTLAQLQSVQALLGGAAGASMATPSPQRAAAPPSMPPSMAAQREQLLARNREALPEDIKRAEGIS